MRGWLLDTNVISELRRPRRNARVRAFVAAQALEELFVSSVTLAEVRFGIETVRDPICRAELSDWLTHKVRPMFDQRVLVEDGRKTGHTFSQPDLFIAATALITG